MELAMTREWIIECWRCSNYNSFGDVREGEARDAAETSGWFRNSDGYQMCPQCSGRAPK